MKDIVNQIKSSRNTIFQMYVHNYVYWIFKLAEIIMQIKWKKLIY